MKSLGHSLGSVRSRTPGHRSSRWALCGAALWWCACSGTTDVVGVIDAVPTDVVTSPGEAAAESVNAQRLEGGARSVPSDGEFLIVAGLPMRDWQGPTEPWPLATPLRVFFSASSWPGGSGPPDHVEREAFERMGVFPEKRRDDVRFAAPTGDAAERLLELFAAALEGGPHGAAPTLVTRDRYDQYLVVLGAASCGRASMHHGGPCPESPDVHAGEP